MSRGLLIALLDDTVYADKDDTLTGCEHAKVRGHGTSHTPKPGHPAKPINS